LTVFSTLVDVLTGKREVWIVGSSYVKRLQTHIYQQSLSANFGVDALNVWFQGYGGLGIVDFIRKIEKLKDISDISPDVLIFHVGGNNIGQFTGVRIMNEFQDIISRLHRLFPKTILVYSKIIIRRTWRYSTNHKAMCNTVRRVNSFVKGRIQKVGGLVFNSEMEINDLDADGVHLSRLGNDKLYRNLREFLLFIWQC
jgi:lysophospholipase L1-like esterase